jgi:hypothetical protein
MGLGGSRNWRESCRFRIVLCGVGLLVLQTFPPVCTLTFCEYRKSGPPHSMRWRCACGKRVQCKLWQNRHYSSCCAVGPKRLSRKSLIRKTVEGLQIRLVRFDSGPRLHKNTVESTTYERPHVGRFAFFG